MALVRLPRLVEEGSRVPTEVQFLDGSVRAVTVASSNAHRRIAVVPQHSELFRSVCGSTA
jgi:hypothetical protein